MADFENAGAMLYNLMGRMQKTGVHGAKFEKLLKDLSVVGDPLLGPSESETAERVRQAVEWIVRKAPQCGQTTPREKDEQPVSWNKGELRDICDTYSIPFPEDDTKKQRQLEIEDLRDFLDEEGISIRYDIIRQKLSITGFETEKLFLTWCQSRLCNRFSRLYKTTIRDYLHYIAQDCVYNPVSDMVDGVKWDGVNRIEMLGDILTISKDDLLSRTLLSKWLIQAYVLATQNDDCAREAEGILCLMGPQGAGKSYLCHKMVVQGDLMNDDQINVDDKDTMIRMTKIWIGELGEVGATMKKSEVNALKAFITKKRDTIRRPFGEEDTELPRRTSYIATTNDVRFLVDKTGNRRWWIIPLTLEKGQRFDRDRVNSFDFIQMWAQVKNIVDTLGADAYKLTADEVIRMEERNHDHEKLLPAADELQAILDDAEINPIQYETRYATLKEIKESYEILRNFKIGDIRDALTQLGCEYGRETKHEKYNDNRVTGFKFPMPKHPSTSALAELRARGIR